MSSTGSRQAPFNSELAGARTSFDGLGPGVAPESGGPCSDRSALNTDTPSSPTDGAGVARGTITSVHAQVPRLALGSADDVHIFAPLSSHETSSATVTLDSGRAVGDSMFEGAAALQPALCTSGGSSASRHSTRRESAGSTSSGVACPGPGTPSLRPSIGSTQMAMADRLNAKLQWLSASNTGQERGVETEAVTPGHLQRDISHRCGQGGEESSLGPHDNVVGFLDEQENDLEAELASMDTALRDLHHSLLASPSVPAVGAPNRPSSNSGVMPKQHVVPTPKQRVVPARPSATGRTVDSLRVEKPRSTALAKKASASHVPSPRPTRAHPVAARASAPARSVIAVAKARMQTLSGSVPRSSSARSARAGVGNARLNAAGTGSAGSSRPGSATSGMRRGIPLPQRRFSTEESGRTDTLELQEMTISRSSTRLPAAGSVPSTLASGDAARIAESEAEIPGEGGSWAAHPISVTGQPVAKSSPEIGEDTCASPHMTSLAAPGPSPMPTRLVACLSSVRAPVPDVPSFTAAMLADAREELGELARIADIAASTCAPTAPLAQMLRTAADEELSVITSALRVADLSDFSLPKRIMELRVSAAQSRQILLNALDDPVPPEPDPPESPDSLPVPWTWTSAGGPTPGWQSPEVAPDIPGPAPGYAAAFARATGFSAGEQAWHTSTTPGQTFALVSPWPPASSAANSAAATLASRLSSLEVQRRAVATAPLSLAEPVELLLPSPSAPSGWPCKASGTVPASKHLQARLLPQQEVVPDSCPAGPQQPSFGQLLPGREAREQQKAAGLQRLPRAQRIYSFDCAQDPAPEPAAAFEEQDGEEEHVSLGAATDASLQSTAFGVALGGVAADMRRALDAIRAARRTRPANRGHCKA